MNKAASNPTDPIIVDVPFAQALSDRYFAYAMSTITARSLPDVRDGLKPVHRRLLYAMLRLKLSPDTGFKKCARVVGDVIGKYHPHGDSSVYDALVRLAQSFAVRYPLVEGQGNFGSIDGDNAAAMRYTEARLTPFAMALLEDLDKDTVDFRDTYDGEENEPVVLPASVPNLLANGSEGIAVGMATNIPPHNVEELFDALLHMMQHPECDTRDLMRYVVAPDFPTGGIVMESHDHIVACYEAGRGSMRVRARWHKEDLGRGTYQVIITEIPYQVSKSRLIEKMADLFKNKKLPLLGDIRDESAEDVRIVLEPKTRTIEPELLMASLFKTTDLEIRYALNMNVLTHAGVPRVLSLKECLAHYLEHRFAVLARKAQYRLGNILKRLNILDGLLVAYLNIDEVIAIIRYEDYPKAVMMQRFNINEEQAEAILNMRLRSLRKLEEIEIKREQAELMAEKKELEEILANPAKAAMVIREQFVAMKKEFGKHTSLGKRRTSVQHAVDADMDISPEAFIEKEPITVVLTQREWIKAIKGHQKDVSDTKLKEGDEIALILEAKTTDQIIFASDSGRFYTLLGDNIPRGNTAGEPLRLMVDLATDERIISAYVYEAGMKFMLVSSAGRGCVVDAVNILSSTKAGKNVFTPTKGAKLHASIPTQGGDMVAMIGNNRKLVMFPLEQVPEIVRGQGVILQRYKDGALADITLFSASEGLSWKSGERTRTVTDLTGWLGHRGSVGKLPPTGFPRSNKFKE
ncbi:MAG: DNA topoisomerase IV subunit A [Alphaproteobacteria bacterium]|nr:MAG: DNA topoisomerase IV subunit A [Alphaproteobacteria bacterium]